MRNNLCEKGKYGFMRRFCEIFPRPYVLVLAITWAIDFKTE